MRIAMFSRFPEHMDQPKGGVESATVGLVRGLSARPGVDLHIVTLEKGRLDDSVVKNEYATIHRLRASRRPMIVDVFGGPGRRRIDECIRGIKPDVVHFQETYGFGGRYPDIPTVFTVHGFDSLNLVTERKYAWWLRAPLWRVAERKGISSHEHIISIAPYVTEQLAEYGLAEIVEIPNAISPEFFKVRNQPVNGRIFFAGWINRRKNVAAAIKTVRELVAQGMDVNLHAAGALSDDQYLSEVRQLIEESGLESRVKLLGRVGQDILRKELQEAQVFLLPSLQENAPMAIAEAMAAGVPIVTSRVCGMPTMVEEGQAGFLVEPNDIPDMARKVATLLQDGAKRSMMSAYVRQKAVNTYHPDSVVAATLHLYERIQKKC
jgi:glycosyltransferase involved in cell wall biosynthesis